MGYKAREDDARGCAGQREETTRKDTSLVPEWICFCRKLTALGITRTQNVLNFASMLGKWSTVVVYVEQVLRFLKIVQEILAGQIDDVDIRVPGQLILVELSRICIPSVDSSS